MLQLYQTILDLNCFMYQIYNQSLYKPNIGATVLEK